MTFAIFEMLVNSATLSFLSSILKRFKYLKVEVKLVLLDVIPSVLALSFDIKNQLAAGEMQYTQTQSCVQHERGQH